MPTDTVPAQALREALEWAEEQLSALVTDDDGDGAFIRGTGTELVGFGAGMKKLRAALASASAPPQEAEETRPFPARPTDSEPGKAIGSATQVQTSAHGPRHG